MRTMPQVEKVEREFTVKEASSELGISTYRLKYAFQTRRHIHRRYAGRIMLVTLSACREALADVGRSNWSSVGR